MFDFENFCRLVKLHLYLNRKLALCLTIGYGLLALLFAYTTPESSAAFSLPLFVGVALITASAFREIHDSKYSIQYLTIPCSSLERYLTLWFLTGPFYLFAVTVIYALGMILHILMHSFIVLSDVRGFISTTIAYLGMNAFFMFGSVFFKRLFLIKTLFVLLGLALIFAVLKAWLITTSFYMLDLPIARQILWSLFAFAAMVAGYFRLKKIELK